MSKAKKVRFVNLQLFSEGSGTASGTTGVTGSDTGSQLTGANSTIVQNPAVQQEGTDVATRFDEMVKGEFKEPYNQRVQDIVQKRLKSSKETVDKYNALLPTLEMLGKKYGVDATDINALTKAIEDDDSYYEEEAMAKNMTVEQLKEIKKMERENASLKKQMEEKRAKENADKLYSQWMQEADSTKQMYPSFDFKAEMQNPKFRELLRSHIDVKTAYEVIHKDEIIPAAMQFAVETAEKNFANKVIANGSRPIENGNSSQGATSVKSDVSQLSKAERARINARVANGERITFG